MDSRAGVNAQSIVGSRVKKLNENDGNNVYAVHNSTIPLSLRSCWQRLVLLHFCRMYCDFVSFSLLVSDGGPHKL